MHMRHKQQGFTMIELIMVIVILGILTAVALPKFYDMQADARISKMKSVSAALRSGMAIAHSAYLVKNTSTTATTSVTMEGTAVPLVNGYPDVNTTVASSGAAIAAGLAGNADYHMTATATVLTVSPDSTRTSCKVAYTEAADASTPPTVVESLTETDCK